MMDESTFQKQKSGDINERRSDSAQASASAPGETGTTCFFGPIDLAEVDHIRIGDEELGRTMILHLPE